MGALPVSVVVVNLDGGEMLERALASLEGQGALETIVVDNGSAPAERERLAARGGIRLIALTANEGFASPSNRGVAAASPDARYVALVNNDCVLSAGYLAALTGTLDADPGLAAVQGVVLSGAGETVDGCGLGWNGRAEAVQLRRGEPPPPSGPPFPVPGVSATAALYRLDAFRAAGGFEESFFAYYEDADLALRMARDGWRFACVPEARARHLGSVTGRRAPAERWRRLLENRRRTLRRNLSVDARRALPAGSLAVRSAAREIGWARAVAAAASALLDAAASRRRDLEILAGRPALTKLPT